jgi:hypothetical protein
MSKDLYDDVLRMYANTAMQALIANHNPMTIFGERDRVEIVRQSWLFACEMRLEELQNGGK